MNSNDLTLSILEVIEKLCKHHQLIKNIIFIFSCKHLQYFKFERSWCMISLPDKDIYPQFLSALSDKFTF